MPAIQTNPTKVMRIAAKYYLGFSRSYALGAMKKDEEE
jgi:hypothetical protein